MLGKIRIQRIQKLHQKKYRIAENRFIAEGTKTILELLRGNFPVDSIIATKAWIEKNSFLDSQVEVIEAEKFELEKITCLQTTPEVLAVCPIPEAKPEDIKTDKLSLVIDAVRDPGNLGTIIRLADWFGVQQILATEDTVEWTNPKCIQACMGSFIRLQPAYCSLDYLSKVCRENTSYGAELDGENLFTAKLQSGGILVVSSESHGMQPLFLENVKHRLKIPSSHGEASGPDSLNVAIATGILLSEFARRAAIQSH
jgi:TrmH family RNA methyltransferase